ncbi:BEM_collapsed_G0030900.mRNA.1.CDS.1 [Saccharomyces cerevisiae]|nr:BEM_HP_G0129910.mRNA.1.CDS.1 [Saccharomyces cerevisiae]CAI4943948.1 BEM_HP_G0140040.mRNA.1.CDS.1 [Saccharomyces cerevisiae]CAI4986491.1 BEM_HP_G0169960.mRNA.1.CDS.1 [Saccharomyces cerevisiae]CAI5023091.1 BEM_HP_G0030910.mRNA.1.CDS.1 [Saccharomyces cerevisiae]CAI5207148.1 BEM_HP_G0109550.mRNA.1.CDS.1 [Saccharomyces cerevisiae]
MKVLEERNAFLSDYEVLKFLTDLEKKHLWDQKSLAALKKSRSKGKQNRPYNHPELQGITRNVVDYLSINKNFINQEDEGEERESSGAKDAEKSGISKMSDESFAELMTKLNSFKLFKAEKLQIVNQLPANMVHLYSIVEECDARFDEKTIEEMLEIISGYA